MIRAHKLLAIAGVAFFVSTLAGQALAQQAEPETPVRQRWSFSGPFGIYDQGQLQRGYKIYKEVCANCHSMNLVAFRNLGDPGGPDFSEAQVKALAAEAKIKDGPNDQGEMFERPGRPADHFPAPFANDQAARAANGGGLPPDMSVLAKARGYERGFPWFLIDMVTQFQEEGPDYIASLLKGYEEKAPQGFTLPEGSYYNKYFPGHAIKMPPPLTVGQVEYTDGSPATLPQYAQDVAAFLMWASEPTLNQRKRIGFQAMIFLIIFAGLMYFTKKRVWRDVKAHPEKLRDQATDSPKLT